jgi:hypothetical protein
MALFHVYADVIRKVNGSGGATGFARYIAREDTDLASQALRYIDREGRPADDLVAQGAGGIPPWAQSSTEFWQAADRYERGGVKRPGTVARTYQMTLPRELSPEARLGLAADIRAVFFERYPQSWAIHTPRDAAGQEQPHMHLILSERGPADSIERGPEHFFRQAAGPHQDPTTHGVRKDRSWQGPQRLRQIRAGMATLINAALEREGVPCAVSHESLQARQVEREPQVYTSGDDPATVAAARTALHQDAHPAENLQNLEAWRGQKAREGIQDLSREAMIDHVRDRFWRHDTTPAREAERQASLARRIAREHARTGRPLQGPRPAPTRRSQQGQGQRLAHQLAGLLRRRSEEEPAHGAALTVRLQDEEDRERSRGIGF